MPDSVSFVVFFSCSVLLQGLVHAAVDEPDLPLNLELNFRFEKGDELVNKLNFEEKFLGGNEDDEGTTLSLDTTIKTTDYLEPGTIDALARYYWPLVQPAIYMMGFKKKEDEVHVDMNIMNDMALSYAREKEEMLPSEVELKFKFKKGDDMVHELKFGEQFRADDEEEVKVSLDFTVEASHFLEPGTLEKVAERYWPILKPAIYSMSFKHKEEPKEESPGITLEIDETSKTTINVIPGGNAIMQFLNKSPAFVGEEEYNEFYRLVFNDPRNPLAKTHIVAEGEEVTFKSLLFVPQTPSGVSIAAYETKTVNIKLFVRGKLIADGFEGLLPGYLNFIRGVVDSEDLPDDVSVELLMRHTHTKLIQARVVNKTIDMFEAMEEQTSDLFLRQYSSNIKMGIIHDPDNRDRLTNLLRYQSYNELNQHFEQRTSLSGYVERMKDGQEYIYYTVRGSGSATTQSAAVRDVIANGYEIIDADIWLDEIVFDTLDVFEGRKFMKLDNEEEELKNEVNQAKETNSENEINQDKVEEKEENENFLEERREGREPRDKIRRRRKRDLARARRYAKTV